ncbi:hypothetical protein NP233_g360 [Leucocoprinus birnbaumii]|uniref:Nephrocystin 3-like N-terminal domain-containing protein n=1 Tax=Leucocoprinus birnbaumii TaxID=56174 RepID=A0AAD5W335_9AGAR|nr:hypothetical protein NP233_g360 [Leucocoprinus birnbaumii]
MSASHLRNGSKTKRALSVDEILPSKRARLSTTLMEDPFVLATGASTTFSEALGLLKKARLEYLRAQRRMPTPRKTIDKAGAVEAGGSMETSEGNDVRPHPNSAKGNGPVSMKSVDDPGTSQAKDKEHSAVVGQLNRTPVTSTRSGIQVLEGAHDVIIQNSTFTNQVTYKVENPLDDPVFLETFRQSVDYGGTVLLVLDKKRVSGVEHDSSEREYAPRCHPETRLELRGTLQTWLSNPQRQRDFIWLSGPAGAGKSAVAQTFAEYCQGIDQLGASFFFSKLRNKDSGNGLVATIAYQLADRDVAYNCWITRILSRNPAILDKTLRIQFQKLIVEPFTVLAKHSPATETSRKPLVIIIDGLDECADERTQCEIIKLISEFVQKPKPSIFSLVWLVCSRPEWHLKRLFGYADPPIECDREEITCNAANDVSDVYCILRDGLQGVYNDTCWNLTSGASNSRWPTESKLQRLSSRVGGLPILASTVLRFIGDGSASPDSLLDMCLLCLEDLGDASKVNPLEILDGFYLRIMTRVSPTILSTTKQLLAFVVLFASHRSALSTTLPVFEAASFLCIDKDTVYLALRHLHSVVDIPPHEMGNERPLEFFHKSFGDFLRDPVRSKSFSLDLEEAQFELAVLCLRWYNDFLQQWCELPSKLFHLMSCQTCH